MLVHFLCKLEVRNCLEMHFFHTLFPIAITLQATTLFFLFSQEKDFLLLFPEGRRQTRDNKPHSRGLPKVPSYLLFSSWGTIRFLFWLFLTCKRPFFIRHFTTGKGCFRFVMVLQNQVCSKMVTDCCNETNGQLSPVVKKWQYQNRVSAVSESYWSSTVFLSLTKC